MKFRLCRSLRYSRRRVIGGTNSFIFCFSIDNWSYPGGYPSLDAALDFPFYFILEEVIKGFTSPWQLRERHERFKTMYTDHGAASKYFVTFVDNHDQMSRPYRSFMYNNPLWQQAVRYFLYCRRAQARSRRFVTADSIFTRYPKTNGIITFRKRGIAH